MNNLFSRIRIKYRPLLIAAALLLPLGGLFYFMFSGFSNDAAFARQELRGNSYQRPLERLLQLLPDHKRLALAELAGDKAAIAAVQAKAAEIDRAFGALAEIDQAIGADLQFTEEGLRKRQRESLLLPKMRDRWSNLKNGPLDRNLQAFSTAHDALLGDVRNCIVHIGDTSNLILDPELDTYYLVDITLGALPGNQERLAHIMDFVGADGVSDLARQNQYAVFAAQLRESDVERTSASLQTSLNETVALRGESNTLHAALSRPLQEYQAAAAELLALLNQQSTNGVPRAAAKEILQKAEGLRAASFTLWNASVDHLDRLLRLRIAGISAKRARACAIVGLFLLGAALVFWSVVRSITCPLNQLREAAEILAQGDLTATIPEKARRDEVGDLARAISRMSENLQEFLREVGRGVGTIAAASTELTRVSKQSATSAKASSEKTTVVAAASEEMSATSTSVVAGMDEATTNLNSVASATEEMTGTISEIAGNSEKARAITAHATHQAQRVIGLMQELSQAAQAIGKVTETVTNIADQTKLLALNATIEAASAGAAGKGFAVVASEIKELARQTGDATEDIKAKVEAIQSSTKGTFADMQTIFEVVNEVSAIVNTIASAIEEQSAVTKDIARNVSQAAVGVKESNHHVAQISNVAGTVAKEIALVSQAASEISSGSELVLGNASDLSNLAQNLRQLMSRFKVTEAARMAPGSGPASHQSSEWLSPADHALARSALSGSSLALSAHQGLGGVPKATRGGYARSAAASIPRA